ncbi:MAG: ATP-binding protein [Candidatus Didemnitutus sp.]|nr:ATP-binding protein [Candidatus Didemnitutus sp.]
MSEVLRIAVYGPESTGKTELAARLGAHFGAPVVAEYARERCDVQGGVLGLEDMVPIAREQWRREDEAVRRAAEHCNLLGYISGSPREGETGECNLIGYKRPGVVICDTDALTTMLWSDLLYGTTPDELRRGAEKRCRNYALYLLLDIDVPFAPDPQRCFPDPEDREKCRRVWHGALERRHLPYAWIRGDWAERERAAIAAVEECLRGGR